ncbi:MULTISPECIES: hypothetical protein [unclassified Pseudovibrio]|uniref:hypothetical protein n=1 Tax=unclassified Pseudovibrio TaxID=2627060 RepID=UPI0007AEC2C8|nr:MULTISPECIES: hypothetical protein [unclassified Pseudovibrio]KZK92556.1 hypothetical protein PsW74_05483 [Pseudovibrio sp. W74]KZL10400.1 hypothetical protein PsAD14_01307 [Pseudovibrio sp. Ad14]
MALQTNGPISLGDVRSELGLSGRISLGDTAVRNLAKRTSGSIALSHLYGKSSIIREPETGGRYNHDVPWSLFRIYPPTGFWHICWDGAYFLDAVVHGVDDNVRDRTYADADGWRYFRGDLDRTWNGGEFYQVYRVKL